MIVHHPGPSRPTRPETPLGVDPKGHLLEAMSIVGRRATIYYCKRCGAWAQRCLKQLARPCEGQAEQGTTGFRALKKLADGIHPCHRSEVPKVAGKIQAPLLREAMQRPSSKPKASVIITPREGSRLHSIHQKLTVKFVEGQNETPA